MDRHDAPEDLKRRIDKLATSNARYKKRVKKLRGLLDERTTRLEAFWGTLQDVQRVVGRVLPTGEPGDWEALLKSLKALIQEHVEYELLIHKMDTQNSLLKEDNDTLRDDIVKFNSTPESWMARVRRFCNRFVRRS